MMHLAHWIYSDEKLQSGVTEQKLIERRQIIYAQNDSKIVMKQRRRRNSLLNFVVVALGFSPIPELRKKVNDFINSPIGRFLSISRQRNSSEPTLPLRGC
jgi:hypothetical protein